MEEKDIRLCGKMNHDTFRKNHCFWFFSYLRVFIFVFNFCDQQKCEA